MIKRSLKWLWYSLAALIIGVAVLVSVGRLLFPQAHRLKPEFERYLAERTGATVRIGEVNGAWRGFGPELRVTGIELLAPATGEPLLKIGRFEAALDLPRSLLSWHAVMRRFEVEGMQALVEMNSAGALILPGLNLDSGADSDISAQYVIDALLRQNRVAITDTEIRYRRRQGDIIPLNIPEVSLHNSREQHQAIGALQVHDGGTARFVLEFSDYPLRANDVMALYVESHSLDLARLPLPTAPAGVHLEDGDLQLQFWANWRDGGWQGGQAKLALKQLQLSNDEQQHKQLDSVSGLLHFARANDERWYLHGEDVHWQVQGKRQPALTIEGMVERDGEGQRWGIDIGALALADAIDLVRFSSTLPASLRQQLTELEVQAALPRTQIDFRLRDEQLTDWAVATQFAQLRYQSSELPMFADSSGRVMVHGNGGALRLRNQQQVIDFHGLFRQPLPIDTIDLGLHWRSDADHVRLTVPQLRLRNPDVEVEARASVDLPAEGEPELALAAVIRNGNGANKSAYLPVRAMSPELVAYLDGAIVAATVTEAQALLRGPLSAFPFSHHDGVFDINASVTDAHYRFQPDWPAITELAASLQFLGNSLFIDVQRGQLAGWKVEPSTVVLDPMSGESAALHVQAQGAGSGKAAFALLASSPLQNVLRPLTDTLSVDGALRSELTLQIPLRHSADSKVQGKVSFGNAKLLLKPLDLPFSGARGEVSFAEYGVQSGEVQLQALGGTVKASIDGDRGGAAIRFRGEAEAAAIASWYPHPMQEHVAGRLNYDGKVLLPGQEQHGVSVEWNSDLRGIAVQAPAPYGKTEAESAPTRLRIGVVDDTLSVDADYRQQLQFQAERRGNEPLHAELLLGGSAFAGHAPGFSLRGSVGKVDAASWIPFIADVVAVAGRNAAAASGGIDAAAETAKVVTASDEEPSTTNAVSGAPSLALTLPEIDFYGIAITDAQLGGRATSAGYQLDIRAPMLTGQVLFADGQPIRISLDKFSHEAAAVDPAVVTEPAPEIVTPAPRREPSSWPQLEIDCKQCRLYSRDLGRLQLSLRDQDADKLLTVRAERKDLLSAKLEGRWSAAEHQTAIKGRIASRDWGKLTMDWGVDLSVRQSSGHVDVDLRWPESPVDFRLRDSKGELELDLGKGYIARGSDNAERVLRVFSLLSLQSITRRLSLDFSDLFRDGFYYDSIRGKFAIADGKAVTSDTNIDGVSAGISIRGETDFVARTLNQQIEVSPKLSSSLPILAGWVINPPAGVVVWLMNKLFIEPAVKVVTGLQYSVRGPWDNPEVIERGRTEKEVPLPEQGLPAPAAEPNPNSDLNSKPEPGSSPVSDGVPASVPEPVPTAAMTQKTPSAPAVKATAATAMGVDIMRSDAVLAVSAAQQEQTR